MTQILAKTDKITLTATALPGGKIRLTGSPWADAIVILADEVAGIRTPLRPRTSQPSTTRISTPSLWESPTGKNASPGVGGAEVGLARGTGFSDL